MRLVAFAALACALLLLAVPAASAHHEPGHLEGGCDLADGPVLFASCVVVLVLIHVILQGQAVVCAETGQLCPPA